MFFFFFLLFSAIAESRNTTKCCQWGFETMRFFGGGGLRAGRRQTLITGRQKWRIGPYQNENENILLFNLIYRQFFCMKRNSREGEANLIK